MSMRGKRKAKIHIDINRAVDRKGKEMDKYKGGIFKG